MRRDPLSEQDLGSRHMGLVDAGADPAEEKHINFEDTVGLFVDFFGCLVGQEVVDLPDVTDRIFPCCCLGPHGSVYGDQSVHTVAPSDLAGVSTLC